MNRTLLHPQTDSEDEDARNDSSMDSTGVSDEGIEDYVVDLVPEADVYNSVVVASFSGVDMHLHNGLHPVKVHPLFLWTAGMLLMAFQAILLAAVSLETDQVEFSKKDPHASLLERKFDLVVKMILVLIVQVMLFREVRHSLETFTFACDLRTWIYRSEPTFAGSYTWLYRNRFARIPFAMMSIVASFAQFLIAHATSQASLSIIFTTDKMTEAIFDSLALAFIIDLDEAFWKVLELNFNIKMRDNFEYRLSIPLGKKKAGDECTNRLGWSALFSRRSLVSLMLTMFYIRQVFSFLVLIEMHVLPTTTQICSVWQWVDEKQDPSFLKGLLRPLASVMVAPVQEKLLTIATGSHNGTAVQIHCDYPWEVGNMTEFQGKTYANLSQALQQNVSGVCHCEALDDFWTPGFLTKSAPYLVKKHGIVSAVGFSVVFLLVMFPVIMDFIVQKHEEMRGQLAASDQKRED